MNSTTLLQTASQCIQSRLGLYHSEEQFPELGRKLEAVALDLEIPSIAELVQRMINGMERNIEAQLSRHLTVGETYFFRHPQVFDCFERTILPECLKRAGNKNRDRISIWSAACSSGEEVYSVAAVAEALVPAANSIQIIGSDINQHRIEQARIGSYRPWSFREPIPKKYQQHFINQDDGRVSVSSQLRESAYFLQLNLKDESFPAPLNIKGGIDVILCRNVLIYFNASLQRTVVARLTHLLRPGGWLVLSPAEISCVEEPQLQLVKKDGIQVYRKTANFPQEDAEQQFSVRPAHRLDRKTTRRATRARQASSSPPRDKVASPRHSVHTTENAGATTAQVAEATDEPGKDLLDPDSYFLQAMSLEEAGKRDEAIQQLKKALYLDTEFAMALLHLGLITLQTGGSKHLIRLSKILQAMPPQTLIRHGDGATAQNMLEAVDKILSRPDSDWNDAATKEPA